MNLFEFKSATTYYSPSVLFVTVKLVFATT